ncbi:uncharacterized protein LOC106174855 [Lingula anatina]|uniref:Uncharacterized protein LOC106174855 n=1 Tax=Lingula anatina TaxID=7574 RepID=A0A1S3JPH6_LINAN|nr:uncharacterized protein LOC106174855 [Lingula anatina]|eukprot:XP_013412036.1 uncharacterized protein LOC106174855 [Lingula anatina]
MAASGLEMVTCAFFLVFDVLAVYGGRKSLTESWHKIILRDNTLVKPEHISEFKPRAFPYHIVNRIPPPVLSSSQNAHYETYHKHRTTFMKRKRGAIMNQLLFKRRTRDVNSTEEQVSKGSLRQSNVSNWQISNDSQPDHSFDKSKQINISSTITTTVVSPVPSTTIALTETTIPAAILNTSTPKTVPVKTLTSAMVVPSTPNHATALRTTTEGRPTEIEIHIPTVKLNASSTVPSNSSQGLHKFFFIKYRNRDSFTSTACLTGLLMLLFVGVWYTKMWQKRVIPYENHDESMNYVSVRDIIKSKARFLPMFRKKVRWLKRKKKGPKAAMKPLLAASSDSEEDLYTQI